MFEDSTFESNGRIRTRSRGWAVAAAILNGSILLMLVLVPLIYPEALDRHSLPTLVEAPQPPPAQPVDPPQQARTARPITQADLNQFTAPTRIPTHIFVPSSPEPSGPVSLAELQPATPGNGDDIFRSQTPKPVVRVEPKGPVPVSSGVMAGLLVHRVIPGYPTLAKAMHIQGTVVLSAVISTTGTIQNLRVLSGPPLLQQAAIDAVQAWQYRPYLLNGSPVPVETTINVVFTLGQ